MKIFKPKFWDNEKNYFSILLLPLSLLMILIFSIRRKITPAKSYNIPIICVGNIYIGGTGKTPLSLLIAKEFLNFGKNPFIIRKFYKSHKDEHNLIRKHFLNFETNNDRDLAIKKAISKGSDLVILDDGFQDHKIKKDVNILCFNSIQQVGNGMVFPSGPLRERLNGIKRAQLILINGNRQINFEKKILEINKNVKIFYSNYKLLNKKELMNHKMVAVSGIANPNNFFNTLKKNGLKIEREISFPDHYKFSESEILKIIAYAKDQSCKVIMTEKDFERIKDYNLKEILFSKIELEILEKDKFIKYIKKNYDKTF